MCPGCPSPAPCSPGILPSCLKFTWSFPIIPHAHLTTHLALRSHCIIGIIWQYHLRQTSVLQFFCSEVEPHAAPVPACGVVILLVRVCVPVPQFLLHVDQAPHAPMTQSTAEICKIDCTMGPGITSTIIK